MLIKPCTPCQFGPFACRCTFNRTCIPWMKFAHAESLERDKEEALANQPTET